MKIFDMMTSEDIKRLNHSSIEELEKRNKQLKERVKELENSRSLNTMDEVAYKELEAKNEENIKEIDRLSEENTNLKRIKKPF